MLPQLLAILLGIAVLIVSADRFVAGAAALARNFGMPSLLIGMVVIGFGTSAPEIVVSIISSVQGASGIALGNAYGSNITNIALILGVTALIRPISVKSQTLRIELPVLAAVTFLALWQASDGTVSRNDSLCLLFLFLVLAVWSIWQGRRGQGDALGADVDDALPPGVTTSTRKATLRLILGLLFLVASSRLLVWGAVGVAKSFGVSDLIIGLTIVAIGTSLPELASSIVAARKGEHDLALGNVIGSNLFNTLLVVGIAGIIRPLPTSAEMLYRDMGSMTLLTVSLFAIGFRIKGNGRINRIEAALLLSFFVGYTAYLISSPGNP